MTVPRIFRIAAVVTALLGAAACSSRPPTPDWALEAQSASERAVKAYLQGDTRVAEAEWRKAFAQVSATGQPSQMARLALLQCAAQVAALEFTDCLHYQRYAAGAQPAEQAYARYLQVQHTAQDVALLPKAQQAMARQVLAGQAGQPAPAAEAALSQLTAAGVAVRAGHLELAGVQQAVQLASAQGWRRSVMAWSLLEQRLHQAAGNAAGVQAVELRLQVLQNAEVASKKK
ncbi:hypothetical protein [Comamonas jiangduensis]|uniref:hypothetical protein n=1 Tax=Comamonas jiangduensis TaxID=1194168 RepID=UPI0028A9A803|nr:hypothetical protein [Comamonas jiangduensis]